MLSLLVVLSTILLTDLLDNIDPPMVGGGGGGGWMPPQQVFPVFFFSGMGRALFGK